MGQKFSSKLLFIYSPTSDVFYIFHISQGSVVTQLRCGGMFSNRFITNFLQSAPVKKMLRIGQYLTKMWTKLCGLFFGPPCRRRHDVSVFYEIISQIVGRNPCFRLLLAMQTWTYAVSFLAGVNFKQSASNCCCKQSTSCL